MEKNASELQTPAQQEKIPPPPTPKRDLSRPFWLTVSIVLISTIAASSYYYYTRLLSPSLNALKTLSSDDSENILSKDDWREFTYESAQIKFNYPKNLSAVEIDSGISISEEGEVIMNIKYGNLGSLSLAEFVSTNSESDNNLISINNKSGLEVKDNNVTNKYFPLFDNDYVVFEIYDTDLSIPESILDTVRFIAPSEAMRR